MAPKKLENSVTDQYTVLVLALSILSLYEKQFTMYYIDGRVLILHIKSNLESASLFEIKLSFVDLNFAVFYY